MLNKIWPIIEIICQAAEAKKALDIKALDVRKSSSLVDYLIICSAESPPQLRALEKEVDKALREHKIKGFRWQGTAESGWIVLDLGAIVVHLMAQKERAYYDLEGLWGKEAIVYHY
ncbi:ribosome silencing factor [Candidatus Saganbacteria bacterium]|nr:ribosome silencing factor [Candidatus Saganbacteria bacterium]